MKSDQSCSVHVRFRKDQLEKLDRLAYSMDLSRSDLVKFAMRTLLTQLEENPDWLTTGFASRIRTIAQESNVPRPKQYKPRQPNPNPGPAQGEDYRNKNPWLDRPAPPSSGK